MMRRVLDASCLAGLVCLAACAKSHQPVPPRGAEPAVSPKITFDVSAISPEGLSGAAGGAVAVSYEFCVPANAEAMAEVQRIDRSARCAAGSRGRVPCRNDEALCIGSTHQEGWLRVLNALAALPYVTRIDRSFAE
jgi:hypothetical protein